MQLSGLGWHVPSPSARKAGSAMKNTAVLAERTPMKATTGFVRSAPDANGFLVPKTSRCEPLIELASSVTAGSLSLPDPSADASDAGGDDGDLASTTGTATVAASSATASGQRRF